MSEPVRGPEIGSTGQPQEGQHRAPRAAGPGTDCPRRGAQ